MKRYVKPDLLVENFELSKHIATCTWDMNLMEKGTCVATNPEFDPDVKIFLETPVCNTDEGVVEEYCYTNGDDTKAIFAS